MPRTGHADPSLALAALIAAALLLTTGLALAHRPASTRHIDTE
jgi:hypothetical protein